MTVAGTRGRERRGLIGGAALAAGLLLAAELPGQQAENYELSGDRVAIYDLAGSVTVEGSSGADVTVAVRRGGPDAGRLEIATGRIDGFETLRVIYPADRVVYGGAGGRVSSELRVREDGTFYGDHGSRDGRKVRIRDRGDGLEAHANLTIGVPRGRTVAVYLAVGEVSVTNVDGDLRVDVGAAAIHSRDTSGRLSLDTGSGSIDVAGARGSVDLDTGSGDVEVSDVEGDLLGIDTGSGSVRGSGVHVSRLSVDTGSGDVELTDIRVDDAMIDTGSGSIQLGLLSGVSSLEADAGSGDITLDVPAGFGAAVQIETGSGSIHTSLPIEATQVGRSYLRGRIGDGRGRVRIETGSGSVTIRGP